MNKNKGVINLGLVISIVLLVAIVGGTAYYLGKSSSVAPSYMPDKDCGFNGEKCIDKNQNSQQVDQNQNTTINSTIIPSDWKTYTNTKYGFELKYPNDWEFSTFPNPDGFFFNDKSKNKFIFSILPRGGFDHGYEEEPVLSDVLINGKQVKKMEWNNSVIYNFTDNTIPSTWTKCGLDLKNCNRIEIQGSDQLETELIDQVLSTFKFIN